MFIGHAAVALAVKPRVPRRSLGWLIAAAFFVDLIWPVLLLAGVEVVEIHPGDTAFTPLAFVHYPWSHSLVMTAAWGVVLALAALRGRLAPARDFLWIAGLVVSHWVLDWVTHRPDLPLVPGGAGRYGLGLWNSVPATLAIEGAMFAGGLAIYLRATRARDRVGSIAFWSLFVLLAGIWLSGPFSPPPPNASAIAIVGLVSWLIPVWAAWADRHRAPRSPQS
jgi:membrane-bound metal-dependent hydrolase YbcI (DUF457 family)